MVGKSFIVNTDISAGDDYPSGWKIANYSGVVFYKVDVDNDVQVCLSASFSTNGTHYRNVCGMARDLSEKHNSDSVLPSSSMTLPLFRDYQLLMVTYVNTYGHMLLDDMTIKPYTILRPILFSHVLMGVVRLDYLSLLM